MKNLKHGLQIISGAVLIAGTLALWSEYHAPAAADDSGNFYRTLEAIPDHDYISEIRRLIADRKYGEAGVLCEDVQRLGLPGAAEAAKLSGEISRESAKVWNRICKAGRAFITGNPDSSIEELGGSIASDMVIYGDIRDLVKQGWFKITGRETDTLIIALSSAGLVTEFVDVADWAPAALKAMKKSGAFTRQLADSLTVMFKKIIRTRKLDNPAKMFFKNTGQMLDSAGFIRTKNMFKNVSHADDLAVLAAGAKSDPALTHLTVRHAGKQSAAVLKKYPPRFLKQIARKGRPALRAVKSYHKHKTALKRTLRQNLPERWLYGLCFALSGAGVFLISTGLVFILRGRRKTEHENSRS